MYAQTRAVVPMIPEASAHPPPSRAREDPRVSVRIPTQWTYRLEVSAEPEVRLAAFAAFVRRALDRAKMTHGWSVERVAQEAGIGTNTVYLWRSGNELKHFPKGETVEAFCDALGIPPAAAYSILWPGKNEKPVGPEPLGPDEDLILLARRLADPSTPEKEKFLIRETIRGLALRPSAPADSRRRRSAS